MHRPTIASIGLLPTLRACGAAVRPAAGVPLAGTDRSGGRHRAERRSGGPLHLPNRGTPVRSRSVWAVLQP